MRTRGRFGRALPRWALGLAVVLGGGAALTACGDGGVALARQACGHIHQSLTLTDQASRTGTDPALANDLSQQAYLQLREALPLAAQAASQNGQWQALMTTISESNRVPESDLVTALTAQCAMANSANPGLPPPPSSVPPPAVGPTGS